MPELPEVETSKQGILPHIIHQKVSRVILRRADLRFPIPQNLPKLLKNQKLEAISRRGKYLLLQFKNGTLILHLGMSGSLRILTEALPAQKHDHVDICFANHKCLRFRDPRRFGAILFTEEDPEKHVLLKHLGKEPLQAAFSGKYLWQKAQNKKVAVKNFIMDSKIVVGVGNIYASEALYLAGLNPNAAAGTIGLSEYTKLAKSIKNILRQAIKQGGTTLRDFTAPSGANGYFILKLNVYGRSGKPCLRCGHKLKQLRIGQRSTVFCEMCQKG